MEKLNSQNQNQKDLNGWMQEVHQIDIDPKWLTVGEVVTVIYGPPKKEDYEGTRQDGTKYKAKRRVINVKNRDGSDGIRWVNDKTFKEIALAVAQNGFKDTVFVRKS